MHCGKGLEGGKEGKSNVIASCSYLDEKFQECSNREGMGLATSVEKHLVGVKEERKGRIAM